MNLLRARFVRGFAVWTTLVGLLVPASGVRACGTACCSAASGKACCRALASPGRVVGSQCPLCRPQPDEPNPAPPCRCQLEARHVPAAVAEVRPTHDPTPSTPVGFVPLIDDHGASAAALNRLAIAAGEMIPFRPPRIVYGVWRN